ncbi:MAG: hypothetical protein JW974_01000 [Alphaproteobacteria bacterium]|nr:hypothetical protein [Alphaproteobacteria bacterium]MBN2675366.1 hypothetical protein [Alphaproteobacteria bacterium]
MTRVLQIRRGTTEQNNDFTGLTGELSFDTEEKNLRVHDGETLGGFKLARADQLNIIGETGEISNFDINTVPASFWENLISIYTTPAIQITESNPSTIANVSYLEYIFGISVSAEFARAILVCQTPEAGYSIGDTVAAFGIGSRANPLPYTFLDESGLHTRLFVASESFWVSHKTSGTQTKITNSNWKIKFTVWY